MPAAVGSAGKVGGREVGMGGGGAVGVGAMGADAVGSGAVGGGAVGVGDVEVLLSQLDQGSVAPSELAAKLRGSGSEVLRKCVAKLSDYNLRDKIKETLVLLGKEVVDPLLDRAGDYLLGHEIRDVLTAFDSKAKDAVSARLTTSLEKKQLEFLLDWIGREKRWEDRERVAPFIKHDDIGVRMQAERTLREMGVKDIDKLKEGL